MLMLFVVFCVIKLYFKIKKKIKHICFFYSQLPKIIATPFAKKKKTFVGTKEMF